MRLVTVGHGTLPQEEFATLVALARVARLVDVRTYPGSRRNPHFRREAMSEWLTESGVRYRWEPRLGGRRRSVGDSPHVALREEGFRAFAQHMQTNEFQAALSELLDEARKATTAIVCAESLWWRCHRRLIGDAALLLHGVAVQHLFHDGRLAPHLVTEAARVERGLEAGRPARIIYDVSADLPLPRPQ